MPYQGGYTPDYNNYGNYVHRSFPAQGQIQPGQMYQQQSEAGAWPPPQMPLSSYQQPQQPQQFHNPQPQSQQPHFQQAQYPQYQQHIQQYNQYQQPHPSRQAQQAGSPTIQATSGSYTQGFQQLQPPPFHQNSFPQAPASPDPIQYYQPPPQRFQQNGQTVRAQAPQATNYQSQALNSEVLRSPIVQQQHRQLPTQQPQPPQQVQQHQQGQWPDYTNSSRNSEYSSSLQNNGSAVKRRPSSQARQPPTDHQQPTPSRSQVHSQPRTQQSQLDDPTRQISTIRHLPSVKVDNDISVISPPSLTPATIAPSLLQRKVTHVQIPLQRTSKPPEPAMAHTPKRRKSNDEIVVKVPQPQLNTTKPPPPSSSPLSELRSSQIPPTPHTPSVDYQAALLSLSDEYISAAYSLSGSVANANVSEEQLHLYHDYLAAGMGCLETVLNNYRITDARREARVRLRLAGLLCDETENSDKVEEILAKGITVCERARLIDLKYAMHHVSARLLFKGNRPKAALKTVEKLINEVEKLNLVHWIYAFRFLRVSLGVQIASTHTETAVITKQLTAISTIASSHSHVAVQIVASTLEALTHLRSQAPDGVDAAQRAIASARTFQLSPEMNSLPQAKILLDCINLACSLVRFNPEQVASKLQTMHSNLDGQAKSQGWSKDGSWLLPLGLAGTSAQNIEADTCGIMRATADGQAALTFQWLPRSRVYMFGFLLSGLASMHKSTSNERKAESFFKEGLKLTDVAPKATLRSMTAVSEEVNAQHMMRIVLRLYIAFAYCGRSDWLVADKTITTIRQEFEKTESTPDASINRLLTYLEALNKHGQGDVAAALKMYRSQDLAIPGEDLKVSLGALDPLRILSGLNSVLILRRMESPRSRNLSFDRPESELLLSRLEAMCKTHLSSNSVEYGNKSLEAAFNILRATNNAQNTGDSTIVQTKQYLTAAVHAAKSVMDNHLMCVVMNVMTQIFFTNIVGEQAEKSARTSRTLAEKSQDKLWTAVANRMYGDTMERCGKTSDAAIARAAAQESMNALPETLKRALDASNT